MGAMTKADIIEGVYEKVGFSKKESAEIVELVFDTVKETLERGEYKRHDEMIDRLLDQGHSPTDIASALIHLSHAEKSRDARRIARKRPAVVL